MVRAERTGHWSYFQGFCFVLNIGFEQSCRNQECLIAWMCNSFKDDRMLNTWFKEDFGCQLMKPVFTETLAGLGDGRVNTRSPRSQDMDVIRGDDSVRRDL